jgi:hypothetical protein
MPRLRIPIPVVAAVLGALLLVPLLAPSDANAGVENPERFDLTGSGFEYSIQTSLIPNAKENTNAIVQNAGNSAATIVMNFFTSNGILIPAASQVFTNVEVGGTRTFVQALNNGLLSGFRGVGVIESNQKINAILARDIRAATNEKAYSIHNAFPTGGMTVTLPFIANNLSGVFNTRFAIANTGTSTACVVVVYSFASNKAPFTDNGSGAGCVTGYPVPAGGQIAFAPTAVDGAMVMPAQTVGEFMAATVQSTGSPVTVSVDSFRSPGNGFPLGSYDGFVFGGAASTTDDHATDILLPLNLKTADGFWSQTLMSNPNNTDAIATLTYSGNVNGVPMTPIVVPITIPANGTTSYGVYNTGNTVPLGFIGSGRVTVSNGVPIAAVVFRGKMTTANSFVLQDLYTAFNGVPVEQADTKISFPLIFRRPYATGPFSGFNSWISIQTANGGVANVTVTAVADTTTGAPGCDTPATFVTQKTFTGSFVFFQNSDDTTVNGFGANPACFWGAVTITSDTPIVGIANVTNDLNTGDNDGTYNGFLSN